MSYARPLETGHYIWSDGENLNFDDKVVPEEAVNIFLFKLFNYRKGEFIERIDSGRKIASDYLLNFRLLDESLSEEDRKEIKDRAEEMSLKSYAVYDSNKDQSGKNIEVFIDTRSTLQEVICYFGSIFEDLLKLTKDGESFKKLSSEQKDEEVKQLIKVCQVIFNSLSQRIIDLSDNKNNLKIDELNEINKKD